MERETENRPLDLVQNYVLGFGLIDVLDTPDSILLFHPWEQIFNNS